MQSSLLSWLVSPRVRLLGWGLAARMGSGCQDGVRLPGWSPTVGTGRGWLLGWGPTVETGRGWLLGWGAGCWVKEGLVSGVGAGCWDWGGDSWALFKSVCSFCSNRKPTMVVRSHYSFLTDSCHFPWFMSLHEPGGEWWLLPPAVRGAKVEGGGAGWSH